MNKAVFLDRDGTLNEDFGYVADPNRLKWLDEVKSILFQLHLQDYKLIVITNQSGVARGYYSEKDVILFNRIMQEQLYKSHGIYLDDFFYCPHHPDGTIDEYRINCGCRKPDISLFQLAINKHSINPEKSIAVGDKLRDLFPANAVGVRRLFLLGNKTSPLSSDYDDLCYNRVDCWRDIWRQLKKERAI